MHVIDLEGNEYPLQATTTNNYELNGNQSLSTRILPTKVNKQFISDLTEMWEVVDRDNVAHKIIYFKRRGEGETSSVEVKAIPLFFDDFDRQRIYEEYNEHMTANYCFNIIFDGSGYNFVLSGSFEAVQWEGFGAGDTRLSMFKDALNRYKAEFRIVGNTVYLENLIGRDTQFMYRYRLNASNIVLEHDASAYYTYAKGYGDYSSEEGWQGAKLIREYTSPIASIVGIREAPPIKNGNITTEETMDDQLETLVDESLKISVSATIHDLRKQGYALAQPEMGDRVFLIDERIGLDSEIRVVKMQIVRDWKGDVLNLNLTFGTPGLVAAHQADIRTGIKDIKDVIEGNRSLPIDVLPPAIKRASQALLGAMTELEVSDLGIIARDVDNPNRLVIYNSAGLGISEDGGTTFENAITYLGINTNLLTAGDIHTNNIRIIGTNNYFFWDGNALQAIDPNDNNRYVELTSNGLKVSNGAIEIKREDGATWLQDGMVKSDYGVSSYDPYSMTMGRHRGAPDTPGGRFEAFFVFNEYYQQDLGSLDGRGTPSVESEDVRDPSYGYTVKFQRYEFVHTARFLVIAYRIAVNSQVAKHRVRVYEESTPPSGYSAIYYHALYEKGDTGLKTIVLDLGVPTYQRRIVDFRLGWDLAYGEPTEILRFRIQRVILTDYT